MDEALLRPGRFDRQIEISLPNFEEREAIFNVHLETIKVTDKPELSKQLAVKTPNFSGADIKNVCNEAAIYAGRKKQSSVKRSDFDSVLDKIMAGVKSSKVLSDVEENTVAYHEAGHAVVGHILKKMGQVIKISIVPRTKGSLGFTQYATSEKHLWTKDDLLDHVCILLAGRASELVFLNEITTGATDDLKKAKSIISSMLDEWHMKESTQVLENVLENDDVDKILAEQMDRAIDILNNNREVLIKLSMLLIKNKTIEKDKLNELLSVCSVSV